MSASGDWLRPDWPAVGTVRALSTTRAGGFSRGAYASLNLGDHVGDAAERVARNRAELESRAGLPASPSWLRQVHGSRVIDAAHAGDGLSADAAITDRPGVVCAVLTADCLPILLCDRSGRVVAAVHGGWRGLVAGIIEAIVAAFADYGVACDDIRAWFGPAISQSAYEVGEDVRHALDAGDAPAVAPNPRGRWQLDLYRLARLRLSRAGVTDVSGGGHCTHAEAARFFSHRRDGTCGRQASLIWRDERDRAC